MNADAALRGEAATLRELAGCVRGREGSVLVFSWSRRVLFFWGKRGAIVANFNEVLWECAGSLVVYFGVE